MKALVLLVRRSLRQHLLSSSVTAAATALAAGLLMSVFAIKAQTRAAFVSGGSGFDAVLGARGSQLQLVLNTVFHLETSPGNIPWSMYEQIRRDPRVSLAVPYAVGDNYQGFRIVGTTPSLFEQAKVGREGFHVAPGGRYFDPAKNEAVVGSFAARKTGLKVGSHFNPYHGFVFDESAKHAEDYEVVGVLEPTSTPNDRAVWIPIDGIYRMKGHVLRGTGTAYEAVDGKAIPDENKEVSAVMLRFRAPTAGFMLDQMINKQGRVATLAWPIGTVMAELLDKLGWMDKVLALVCLLTALVSTFAILAALYNTINERRREFAILRALGARKATVFSAIIMESAALAAIGSLAGFAVYAVIVAAAASVLREQTGVVLEAWRWHPALALTPLGLTAVGAFAGTIPAFKAYSVDVAEGLSPQS
jgi:putative ABC transport system permease protein